MNFGHCKIVVPIKPTPLVSDIIKNVSSVIFLSVLMRTPLVLVQGEKRYRIMEKSKIKILTLKNKNGAYLFPDDRILEVIDDNDFLTADFSDTDV